MGRVPSLAGKVVLITGAGAGIGAAGARELHRRGARPVLVDCDRETVEAAAAAIGSQTMALVADVTSAADCEAAVAAVIDRHQRIDIVWANAGVAAFGQLAHAERHRRALKQDEDAKKEVFIADFVLLSLYVLLRFLETLQTPLEVRVG
jgi:NADP-dependent 3-hydroxy acid dehydrogenase YdfG